MADIIMVSVIIAVAAVYVARRLLFKRSCCGGADCGCPSSGRKGSTGACTCCSGKK